MAVYMMSMMGACIHITLHTGPLFGRQHSAGDMPWGEVGALDCRRAASAVSLRANHVWLEWQREGVRHTITKEGRRQGLVPASLARCMAVCRPAAGTPVFIYLER
ncbi:unnamed protein product [Periconia digitata]|uniref:Uncharacterized protein n=1 Tax=Periconia digitata TaxID=1303443 RepID=A0A9W4US81_9PLEO|nr:unnamed protein product [Periconia digitata]